MRYTKAQAAMEFLMSYGWAIIVVIILIAALANFGVIKPGKYLPVSCTFEPGIGCVDSYINTTTFTIVLVNGMGVDINLKRFDLISVKHNFTTDDITPRNLTDGQKTTYYLTINNSADYLDQGERGQYDIKITYSKLGSSLEKILEGTLIDIVH